MTAVSPSEPIAAHSSEPLAVQQSQTAEVATPGGFALGNPAILGVPAFLVAIVGLSLFLLGYLAPAAEGGIMPVIFDVAGLGVGVATLWAIALGQNAVACIFGLFTLFWFSFAALVLGLDHNWYVIPPREITHTIALFLICWLVVFAALTLFTLRLPSVFTGILFLVDLAIVFVLIATINGTTWPNRIAGICLLGVLVLGMWVFASAASEATGGPSYDLGTPILH